MYARHKQYQHVSLASRIEAADPHALVAILYEELIRAIDVCRAAIVQAKPEALGAGQDRATSILLSLIGSLDADRGGSLAGSLGAIYHSMRQELARAVRSGDDQKLAEVRQGVTDLLSAWLQIQYRRAA